MSNGAALPRDYRRRLTIALTVAVAVLVVIPLVWALASGVFLPDCPEGQTALTHTGCFR